VPLESLTLTAVCSAPGGLRPRCSPHPGLHDRPGGAHRHTLCRTQPPKRPSGGQPGLSLLPGLCLRACLLPSLSSPQHHSTTAAAPAGAAGAKHNELAHSVAAPCVRAPRGVLTEAAPDAAGTEGAGAGRPPRGPPPDASAQTSPALEIGPGPGADPPGIRPQSLPEHLRAHQG